VAEQRLYWVDIKARHIHRFDPTSGRDEAWPTSEDVGSLAVREGSGLVVALVRVRRLPEARFNG
jgi:sugar lactone lactonase YvrE